ncbi:PKD domain-containing protein [Kitasatospora sp. MMS16-BH015]|uniref:PKD domain-containing protein n=1 Tax=Kitasatospora sp. MMS16-BH015 TaxID=2018025 RepID=UPI00131A5102|nr:PKD domain-containing protein [Kitasatospora sp. MMS16-BH015]
MRRHRTAAVAALVLSATAGLPLTGAAHAASLDRYVDKGAKSCTDTSPDAGSETTPYCTISAAASTAKPGQTVHISAGEYGEEVHITRSGAPGAPITFIGSTRLATPYRPTTDGVSLEGVHDVVVRGLDAQSAGTDFLVSDSSHVVLDHDQALPHRSPTTGIRVTGHSSDVTVSRNTVTWTGDGIVVDPGVTHAVITTNLAYLSAGNGIRVTDAPGTIVTGNSLSTECATGIVLAGASSGASIENNVIIGPYGPLTCPPGNTMIGEISVSAASASGTTADYNVVPSSPQPSYEWAGESHADPAAFHAATGQGAHDLIDHSDRTGSEMVDSADQNAPGELDTDIDGNPRVDDPLVPDTGTGKGYYDRGAKERTDSVWGSASPQQMFDGDNPYEVTMTVTGGSAWSTMARTTLDFGDGSAPVTYPGLPRAKHTYAKPGLYYGSVTVTDALGASATDTVAISVKDAPVVPQLQVWRTDPQGRAVDGLPLRVRTAYTAQHSRPIVGASYDYGDGTPATTELEHTYAKPGAYRITLTATDDHGSSGSSSQQITVGAEYVATKPTRLLDTRTSRAVGPGQSVKIDVSHAPGVQGFPTAVQLNLTATQPTAAGYVSAYPSGGTRPTVSSLNFTAGQTVANAAVVPVGPDGTITLYNHSGTTQLIADLNGYYTTERQAAELFRVEPTRVLDTRTGLGDSRTTVFGPPLTRLGADETLAVKVAKAGVPANATSVTLNLTATGGTESSYISARPGTSNLNFAAGQTVANQVTLPLEADGSVHLFNHNGQVHLIADVQGYSEYQSGGAPYVPVAPTRLLDTRATHNTLGQGGALSIRVAGSAGVPTGAKSVLVNLTATNPTTAGYLTAYAAGAARPTTSNLNFTAGQTVPNLAMVPLSADGSIEVYNFRGRTDVVIDIQGYVS